MQPIQFFAARAEDGALLPNATVDVFITGTETRATLFSDAAGTTSQANPLYADGVGRVFFYTSADRIDIRVSRSGYVAPLIEDLLVTDPSDVLAATVAQVQAAATQAARAEAARDASLLGRGVWPSTAAGVGQGIAGTSSLVAGSGGTNGTFALAFSGGTQVLAPKGRFVVEGGAVAQVILDYPGYYSAGTPTISFAASPGLNGASVAAVMGPNTAVGSYFSTPSSLDSEYLIRYEVAAGPAAVNPVAYPSKKALDDLGFANLPDALNELVFAITDDAGRRTWIEIGLNGKPTSRTISIFSEAITPSVGEALGFEELTGEVNEDILFSVVDEKSARTWLEVSPDGGPTAEAAKRIKASIGVDAVSGDYIANGEVYNIVSGPDIVGIGDSMTAGAGGGGVTYLNHLQSLLDDYGYTCQIINMGVGGESSVTATARTNANPFVVDVAEGEIPASGQVALTLRPINGVMPQPLKQGPSAYSCKLAGVAGSFGRTITEGVYSYHFTRAVEGGAVTAPKIAPIYLDIGEQIRGLIHSIWIGQNGPDFERAIQDTKAIINHMTALDKRFVVISKPGGTSAQDVEDAAWFAEFGNRFIPIRQYLVEFGLEEAGITPTAQDLTDISNGTVPSSLRVDSVHFTADGYRILGNLVFQKFLQLGWI